MGTLAEPVEFYLGLYEALLRKPFEHSEPFHAKHLRVDIRVLRNRTYREGLSFLTKTLPKLGKSLDRALETGRLYYPSEFGRSHSSSEIPAFLQVYFKRIFALDGTLLEHPCELAISHIRLITMLCYKLELPYSPEIEVDKINSFVENEKSLETLVLPDDLVIESAIASTVFSDFDETDILPKHGPGAVATGEKLDEKYEFKRLYNSIHQVYPYYKYFVVGSSRELLDRLSWYKSLERLEEGTAKVCLVPKDSRGPRIISSEPLEYMWLQQGLGRKIVDRLQSNFITKGNINFTSQAVNRELALESSLSQRFATIDMKDASDLVSVELVKRVFCKTPNLLRALLALRTTSTRLPDGRTIPLLKYAPMGSALCFPVESFIFWVLCVAAIRRSSRMRLRQVCKLVYTYGDDLIIPVEYVQVCIEALENCGLKVNRDKSLFQGKFRESCGLDAYNGVEVTPIKIHTLWTGRRNDGAQLASYCAIANELGKRQYNEASDYIWTKLDRLYGFVPYGTSTSGYPCKIVESPEIAEILNRVDKVKSRFSERYQRLEFFVRFLKPKKLQSTLDSWTRLIRNLCCGVGDEPSVNIAARSVKLSSGWNVVG